MFFILFRTNFAIWVTFNGSSANAFNSNWSNILWFGKELKIEIIKSEFKATVDDKINIPLK